MFAATCATLLVTTATLWLCGAVPWWLAVIVLASVASVAIDCEEYDGDDDL